jgi:hypothetical protein
VLGFGPVSDGVVRLPSARRLEVQFEDAAEKIAGRIVRSVNPAAESRVRVIGAIERTAALLELIGSNSSDADLVRAIWERFGWGGFLRVSGPFAAAIAGPELCLARSPTFGAERAIYFREAQDDLQFSTEIADFAFAGWNIASMRGWLLHRLWLPRGSTPFEGVSVLEPGAALIASRDGRRIERFWSFTPYAIPRLLPEADARAEVEAVVRACLSRAADADLRAEAPALGLLSRLTNARPASIERDFSEAALRDAYRRLAHPVPLSEAAEIAALVRSDRPLVTDLGMREVMGATDTALGAYVESVSSAFGDSPRPSTLLGVLRAASPIDRRLARSRLVPSLIESAVQVGNRWKRHLPPALSSLISLDLPAAPIADPVTGDRFVDRRFAEALDPGLAARHRAIASVRPVIAPFLDPRSVELAFSLPKPHFIGEGRILRVVDGGAPLTPIVRPTLPSYPDDHPFRRLPRRWFSELERDADDDRWLGLGAFLSAWEEP